MQKKYDISIVLHRYDQDAALAMLEAFSGRGISAIFDNGRGELLREEKLGYRDEEIAEAQLPSVEQELKMCRDRLAKAREILKGKGE